jgi:CheY-like chemotaxis protein
VAKILVADDNSNIQRMVGLALKDQGIEVVAVGNGEAAVRKISELRPDLVLADVFMPVRNGYEVCQYVKEDSSLAHIPVILLVGAFDPLDEQEAQRVGADGVLKKPFVPPDPLIAMVKAALLRAGISLTPAGAEKVTPPAPRKAADLLPPAQEPTPAPTPSAPRVSPLAGIAFSRPPAPEPIAPFVGDEKFVDEPALPEPVRIDEAKHTMAFGNLLGPTTTAEDPGFAAEEVETKAADWRALDEPDDVPEEDEEEPKESAPSWRRDGDETVFHGDDGTGPVKDWRDSAVVQTAGRQSARETWEQTEEKSGFVSATEVPAEMGAFASEMIALEAESLDAKTHGAEIAEAGPGEAAEPEFSKQAESSFRGDVEIPSVAEIEFQRAETAAEPSAEETAPAHSEREAVVERHADAAAPEPAVVASDAAETVTSAQPDLAQREEKAPETAEVNSWFSRPTSPWDSDSQKTNRLASTWETKAAKASETENPPEEKAANGQSSSEELAAVISDEPVAEVASTPAKAAPEPDMDALVAKVMARISPEVLQAVTREILKPVVAAILEDELKLKK